MIPEWENHLYCFYYLRRAEVMITLFVPDNILIFPPFFPSFLPSFPPPIVPSFFSLPYYIKDLRYCIIFFISISEKPTQLPASG